MFKVAGSRAPYGYAIDETRHLKIDEENAFIVRRVFELYHELMSNRKVADVLNFRDVPLPRNGQEWGMSRVSEILKNEIYIGNLRRLDNYAHFEDLRIVSDELWNEVQKIKEMDQVKKRSYNKIRGLNPYNFKVYMNCPLKCGVRCEIQGYFTYDMVNRAKSSSFTCKDCNRAACSICGDADYILCQNCIEERLRR